MTVNEVILTADRLRPNTVPWELKAKWIFELEAMAAEMMGAEEPQEPLTYDGALLLPDNHNGCYVWKVCAEIDMSNKDSGQYERDYGKYAQEWAQTQAWYRRNHRPKQDGQQIWRVM